MRRFIVSADGPNRVGLRELCQRFAGERWIAAHMTPEQRQARARAGAAARQAKRLQRSGQLDSRRRM
jgi:hypothetical protein